jgi:plastocyanin
MTSYLRLAGFVPVLAVLTLVSTGGHAAETKVVTIEGLMFQPAVLTVKQGDTVVWKNADLYAHTATAKGAFDSKEIAPSGTWKFTAKKKGSFPYICTLHPTMKGTLVVK